MRNLMQYPITLDEMIEALTWAQGAEYRDWEARGHPIGDIRGPALKAVTERLKAIKEWDDAGR